MYSRKKRKILQQVLLFHFSPVCINFALLGLYIRQVIWVPPWPTTNILNTLQFASKVHETLMIASLTRILLHNIRYRLLSTNQGVPLGIVTSPFRLLDFTYLWSQEFLSASWSGENGIQKLITIVLHIYLFTLATILGPASASSMLPRLGEWKLAETVDKVPFYVPLDGVHPFEIYIGGQLSDLYPQRITADFIPEACDYGNLSRPQSRSCPRRGLEDILRGWLPAHWDTRLDPSQYECVYSQRPKFFNITVQNDQTPSLLPRTMCAALRGRVTRDCQTISEATTSPDFLSHLSRTLLEFYSQYWFGLSQDIFRRIYRFNPASNRPARFELYPRQMWHKTPPLSWIQPYVSSFCSMQRKETYEPQSLSFVFDRCLGSTPDCGPTYTVNLDTDSLPKTFHDTGMGFINVSNMKITPSLTPSLMPSAAFIYNQSPNTTLCVIRANWINLTIAGLLPYKSGFDWMWPAPPDNPDYFTGEGTFTAGAGAWINETNPDPIIHLDLEWLSALDSGTGTDYNYNFFQRLRQGCLDWLDISQFYPGLSQPEKKLSNICMAFGISLGIAEGLSKIQYHANIYAIGTLEYFWGQKAVHLGPSLTLSPWGGLDRPGPTMLTMMDENWTSSTLSPSEIRETATRLDFAVSEEWYGYGFHSVTTILAFVVLFLYVATVFIHIFIISFGTPWSSSAWKSVGEFLVLAIQSPTQPALENTGGGVKSSRTWKARVSIQELEGNKVGMTVKEPGLSGTENGSGSESRVRPDWKYS